MDKLNDDCFVQLIHKCGISKYPKLLTVSKRFNRLLTLELNLLICKLVRRIGIREFVSNVKIRTAFMQYRANVQN